MRTCVLGKELFTLSVGKYPVSNSGVIIVYIREHSGLDLWITSGNFLSSSITEGRCRFEVRPER